MKQVINGKSIVRVKTKPKTKRVRRRKKVNKENSIDVKEGLPIITKPAI